MSKWQPMFTLQWAQAESWGGDNAKVGRLVTFDAGIFDSKACVAAYLAEQYPDPAARPEVRSPRGASTVTT